MMISVIIPTLNEARTIADRLSQTACLGFGETIVVDGGSEDDTVTIAKGHPSGTRVLTALCGRARQMNEGAKSSRGDILLFLHADTRLPHTALQAIQSTLADPAVIGGRFDVRFDSSSTWALIISAFMNLRSRWSGIATGDQAIFVRRHIFERLNGFADIPLMEDIDFSRRLKRQGRLAMLPDQVVTSFRRWEQNGPIKTILLMWSLRFLYWLGVSPHRLQRYYAVIR